MTSPAVLTVRGVVAVASGPLTLGLAPLTGALIMGVGLRLPTTSG